MSTTPIYNNDEFNSQEQAIDYKALLFKILSNWYLFAIAILISLALAFMFNKYTKPVYKVKTTVLIKGEQRNMIDPQKLLGLGSNANHC